MRVIVAWSAALTLLYTPLLKRMTGVKNMVVAAIIAASPLSGALAAGAVWGMSGCESVGVFYPFANATTITLNLHAPHLPHDRHPMH